MLNTFEEKVVNIKYNNAALKQKVSGECETFEAILDCRIISTNPVTDIKAVSFNVICQTFPKPGNACFKICGAKTLIKV